MCCYMSWVLRLVFFFFFSSRRRHTRCLSDWSSDVCSSDLDLSIDEASFRKHLRDVAGVEGLSAVTINAHSTEVASCSFDEQRRVLDITEDEIGNRLPIVNGIWADGSI